MSDITHAHPYHTGYGSRRSLLERLIAAVVSGVTLGLVDQETLFLTGTREGCLRHLELATGRLSAPLACGFLVDCPAPLFGWPVFSAGASGP